MIMTNKLKSFLLFFSTLILTTLIMGCDDNSIAPDIEYNV